MKPMCKLLKKQGLAPRALATDKLPSCGSTRRELSLSTHHEQGLRKNSRVENSHQVVRRRDRKMQGFKSPGSDQRLLSIPQSKTSSIFIILSPAKPGACSGQTRRSNGSATAAA